MTLTKLAIIQARLTSSRLPGKVMREIAGKPMLQHMLERLRRANMIDGFLLVTTIDPSDDALTEFANNLSIPCFRGSLHDVLDRYYQAALQYHADVIIRLTADCPLIDPEILDRTVGAFLGISSASPSFPNPSLSDIQVADLFSLSSLPFHFAANRLPPPWKRTLPIGLDVEVCSLESLEHAWKKAHEPHQREHVMPYLYEGVSFATIDPPIGANWYIQQGTTPRGFNVALLNHSPDLGSLRWTVDTPQDLEFVRQVFARFDGQDDFGWLDILTLLEKEPGLASINAGVKHKSAFDVDERSMLP